MPPAAGAAVSTDDFPAGTLWYLHADLARMRDTASGRDMYQWLNGEVFVEISDEIGIDVNKEVDRITAFSNQSDGTVVVVEGAVSKTTRDKVLAVAALQSTLDMHDFAGMTYYYSHDHHGKNSKKRSKSKAMHDLQEAAYFSFDVPGRFIIAAQEGQIKELLQNKGRIAGAGSHDGALFVLTADKEFVQAGLRTEHFADDDDGWNSNILRNTEQAAILVSDRDGFIAVEAKLKSSDARMAGSIGSIINGLISLQMFNTDLDPELRALIQSTKIEVLDTVLQISTVFDPDALMRLLEH
jgi:hypothetical protein